MSAPDLKPEELPEWMQRDIARHHADRRAIFAWRLAIAAFLLGAVIGGALAFQDIAQELPA